MGGRDAGTGTVTVYLAWSPEPFDPGLSGVVDGPWREVLRAEDHLLLVGAMRRLTASQREVLALHYFANLSVADIAFELGVPEGTVKSRIHQARRELRGLLRA